MKEAAYANAASLRLIAAAERLMRVRGGFSVAGFSACQSRASEGFLPE